jgi:hypothetical protein
MSLGGRAKMSKYLGTYGDYLKTPHWATMRRLALEMADRRCQLCNSQKGVQVHHRDYARLGEEKLSDLTVLCPECHKKHHGIEEETLFMSAAKATAQTRQQMNKEPIAVVLPSSRSDYAGVVEECLRIIHCPTCKGEHLISAGELGKHISCPDGENPGRLFEINLWSIAEELK